MVHHIHIYKFKWVIAVPNLGIPFGEILRRNKTVQSGEIWEYVSILGEDIKPVKESAH